MLEHLARRYVEATAVSPRHHFDELDGVSAELEEIGVNPDPLEPEHLGPGLSERRLDRCPRRRIGRG